MTVPVVIGKGAAAGRQKISRHLQENAKQKCLTLTCQMLPLMVSFAIHTLQFSVAFLNAVTRISLDGCNSTRTVVF